jgi:hypothetical protein
MLKIFAKILSGILLFTCAETTVSLAKEPITVVFRYDDYSNLSAPLEDKMIEVFLKEQIPLTLGVIPFDCDDTPLKEKKIAVLHEGLKTGLIEVAVHGYCHQNINPPEHICDTEFEGETYTRQHEKITTAKSFLEKTFSRPMQTFIPPFNTYDLNTLNIIENLQFKTLSADKNRIIRKNSTLKFLPKTCDLLRLKDTIQKSHGFIGTNPIIVVLLHPYDFKELHPQRAKFDFHQMVEILKWVKQQPNVQFKNIGQASEAIKDLSPQRYRNYQRSFGLRNFIPENKFLNFWIPGEIYLSFSALLWVIFKFGAFCLALILGEVLFVKTLAKFLKKDRVFSLREIILSSAFLLIYLKLLGSAKENLGAMAYVGLMLIFGFVLGVWMLNWQIYKERKKNVP